jgi:hypothetical protein
MKSPLLLQLFLLAALLTTSVLAQVQIINISGEELRFASMYDLNETQSLLFSISYNNETFGTKVLNAFLVPANDDVVDSTNNATLSSIFIQISSLAYSNETTPNLANITWGSKEYLFPNGTAVVVCQNYSGFNFENGTVFVSVVFNSTNPSTNITVALEIELDLENDCNIDNFKSSTIIWVLLAIIIVVAIIAIIAAAIFAFTYWKKKKLAGSALYNDL